MKWLIEAEKDSPQNYVIEKILSFCDNGAYLMLLVQLKLVSAISFDSF